MIKAKKIGKDRLRPKTAGQRLVARIWDYREMYLMLLPAFVYVFIFAYIPMYGIIIGFQDMVIGDPYGQSPWVGLYHFELFFNGIFIEQLLLNTIRLTFIPLFIGWPLTITFALLLHNCTNTFVKKAVQNITYVPNLMSLVIVISILNMFVRKESGLLNIILMQLGREPIDFRALESAFMPMYVISGIWAGLGSSAIIYLGALSGVDEEMVEAARIDGANKLRIIWHIQLPAIKPTIVTMIIMNFGTVFAVGLDKILLMQNGMNKRVSNVISTYVYEAGIISARYSFSTAVGMFQNVVNIAMMSIVNYVSDKLTGIGIF